MLGIRQCESGGNSVICTIDKDLKQIPGYHYNFVTKEKFTVSDEEGTRFFYYQMLVGDPTDHIKGVVGIGKAKATKLLLDADHRAHVEYGDTELAYFEVVREAYSNDEEMLMNARCLWIQRYAHDDPLEHFKRLGGNQFGEATVSES